MGYTEFAFCFETLDDLRKIIDLHAAHSGLPMDRVGAYLSVNAVCEMKGARWLIMSNRLFRQATMDYLTRECDAIGIRWELTRQENGWPRGRYDDVATADEKAVIATATPHERASKAPERDDWQLIIVEGVGTVIVQRQA